MYNTYDVSMLLKVSPGTVRTWVKAGKIHGTYSKYKGWQFSQTDLDAFLQSHKVRHWDKTPEQRFWAMVEKSEDPDACWIWKGTKASEGYGSFYLNGRMVPAHRYSWELVNGPIPTGMLGCHTCDNPPCVRPAHIFIGTYADNAQDMARKGRCGILRHPDIYANRDISNRPRGEQSSSAKLTDSDIPIIRELVNNGISRKEVARRYCVAPSTIESIVLRKSWAHIP